MAKRKAAVNDIIYELDNEDIVLTSDDEVKDPKINRLETVNSTSVTSTDKESNVELKICLEAPDTDKLSEDVSDNTTPQTMHNGGKTPSDVSIEFTLKGTSSKKTVDEVDCVKKIGSDSAKATILNEDIVIDSPGNSDLGVEGCENRTPLVTVRFKDSKMANNYKKKVKAFMLKLIKLHEGESLGSETETDVELDIWPEDLIEPDLCEKIVEKQEESSLFFVDTDPCADRPNVIPRYSQATTVITNAPDKEPIPPPLRRGPCCFNCDGAHQLRECKEPRDHVRIQEKRKAMHSNRVGRYHVEDEQKYGHLIPGRISGQLRHALGLKRTELPMHIYRMRLLGYPPGWLEEARISHSGITMFDSTGNAMQEPEEEEGELTEPGFKDKFDIKKILDFPGFNVKASSRYVDESEEFGLPHMADQDSKMAMLQFLAPNAMKAYKRKKLAFFPSASANNMLEGQGEMELDSGDEIAEFPSNPPLPDEAPPPPPPPPPQLPPPPPPQLLPPPPPQLPPPPPPQLPPPPLPQLPPPPLAMPTPPADDKPTSSGDDVEIIEIIKVADIPIPITELITIDEDDDKSQSSGRGSPTLDDLEEKKRLLLTALEGDVTVNTSIISILDSTDENIEEKITEITDTNIDIANVDDETQNNEEKNIDNNDKPIETSNVDEEINKEDSAQETVENDADSIQNTKPDSETTQEEPEADKTSQESKGETISTDETPSESIAEPSTEPETSKMVVEDAKPSSTTTPEVIENTDKRKDSETDVLSTPESKPGEVKATLFGTPVMNIASSYLKLPTEDKFAKDITDIINFENLPNSTGKYKKISALLKKVKDEVDRIQES